MYEKPKPRRRAGVMVDAEMAAEQVRQAFAREGQAGEARRALSRPSGLRERLARAECAATVVFRWSATQDEDADVRAEVTDEVVELARQLDLTGYEIHPGDLLAGESDLYNATRRARGRALVEEYAAEVGLADAHAAAASDLIADVLHYVGSSLDAESSPADVLEWARRHYLAELGEGDE